jgi:hypothetical protein
MKNALIQKGIFRSYRYVAMVHCIPTETIHFPFIYYHILFIQHIINIRCYKYMYTTILFHPIVKYILIFIISYMYLNSIETPIEKIIPILIFTTLITVLFDVFMFDDFITIIQKKDFSIHDVEFLEI